MKKDKYQDKERFNLSINLDPKVLNFEEIHYLVNYIDANFRKIPIQYYMKFIKLMEWYEKKKPEDEFKEDATAGYLKEFEEWTDKQIIIRKYNANI